MEEQLYHEFFRAEDRHWWFIGRKDIILDTIVNGLRLPPAARILDVGCGTGAMIHTLQSRYEVFGTDTSELAIKFCKERGLTNVFHCDLQSFPRRDLRFDLILMLDVVEHVEDDVAFIGEALALLKDSGALVITVPAYQFLWSRHDDVNHHKRRYTRNRLRAAIERAGSSPQRISYFNTILFPVALVDRLLRKWLPPQDPASLPVPPTIINQLLTRIFSSERHLLRLVSLPLGLSIMAIARRPLIEQS